MTPHAHLADPRDLAEIDALLREDEVCRRVLLFLLEHEAAMDTARGIAAWWAHCDELAVHTALDRLLACGALTARTLTSGTLYGLTRSEETRAWLRARHATLLRTLQRA